MQMYDHQIGRSGYLDTKHRRNQVWLKRTSTMSRSMTLPTRRDTAGSGWGDFRMCIPGLFHDARKHALQTLNQTEDEQGNLPVLGLQVKNGPSNLSRPEWIAGQPDRRGKKVQHETGSGSKLVVRTHCVEPAQALH